MVSIEERSDGRQDEQDQPSQASFWPEGPPGPEGWSGHLHLEKGGEGEPANPKTKEVLAKIPAEMECYREIEGTGFQIGEGKKDPGDEDGEQTAKTKVRVVQVGEAEEKSGAGDGRGEPPVGGEDR